MTLPNLDFGDIVEFKFDPEIDEIAHHGPGGTAQMQYAEGFPLRATVLGVEGNGMRTLATKSGDTSVLLPVDPDLSEEEQHDAALEAGRAALDTPAMHLDGMVELELWNVAGPGSIIHVSPRRLTKVGGDS